MSGYKEYNGSGAVVKYFPDNKILVLSPLKNQKAQFDKLRSRLDTLLQIDGQKQSGNSLSLKLNDTVNVNVDELLKSLNLRGGIEREDAASMADDAAREQQQKEQSAQSPEAQTPQASPAQPGTAPELAGGLGAMPESINLSVFSFLFEDFFAPGKKKGKRKSKRYGEYWRPIEQFLGKNRNAVKTDDILMARKKYALKPPSEERDLMLTSLDKAASYFFSNLNDTKGPAAAEAFDEKYVSIDALRPDDYKIEEMDATESGGTITPQLSFNPNFDDIDYDDVDIEQ